MHIEWTALFGFRKTASGLFPEPEFAEAIGILEVIIQTPERRDEYISRLKFQLDETARLEFTRDEALKDGEAKGRQEGAIMGRIETLQELLGVTEPTSEESV